MSKRYLIWKHKITKGENPEWLELSGVDFFRFFNSPESEGRYFILLDNDICPDADVLYLEATEEQFKDWLKEHDHHQYLKKYKPKKNAVSLDAPSEDDETLSLHDLVADLSVNVEAEVMSSVMLGLLPIAINSLNELLHEAIMLKYFKYPDLSDRQIAELICIEEKAFVKRKERALKKLLDFFKK